MQNLTPLEIQKQGFSKVLNGFSVDEVRAYLHIVAEQVELLLKEIDRLARENAMYRDENAQHSEREQILKQTLLSAQQVAEDVKANARKEAELIVKDAELLSDRITSQAMSRVGDLQRTIQELKLERKAARNKLQATLDTFQQMLALDIEQEAGELPITQMYRKNNESA
ncbi:MAG TPA: DivIVA domain-containing protein [Thermoanaerobaculia bacterium]|nr:DivIVA domain-containing protein [Thermoanaerobaculia bacterium]